MSYGDVIKLFGILAGSAVIITFTLGFFKIKIKERLKIHKVFGILALILALTHGSLVILRSL